MRRVLGLRLVERVTKEAGNRKMDSLSFNLSLASMRGESVEHLLKSDLKMKN